MPATGADASADTLDVGAADRIIRLDTCHLQVSRSGWDYSAMNAPAIDSHWERRQAESPAMFNGVIHLMHSAVLEKGTLRGSFTRTDFKSFLHWREHGSGPAGVRDAFGSALIRSKEGHVVLGRQRAGNVNSGQAYPPGGFIDPRDVAANGDIDIDRSILRELTEETGIPVDAVAMQPGYIATFAGPLLSLARELRSPLPATELREMILAHIADDPKSELTDAVIVTSAAEIDGLDTVPFAARLLRWYFTRAD